MNRISTAKKVMFTYTKELFLLRELGRRGADSEVPWLDVTLIFKNLRSISGFLSIT